MISVIVPVYNKEKYLARCIDSILRQTYSDTEILLIDDGSRDASAQILDSYGQKDKRVRVFHIENGGVMHARNFGARQARGEYLTFVDADDTLESDYLELLHAALCSVHADIAQCSYSNVVLGEKKPVGNTGSVFVQDSTEAIHYLLSGKLFSPGLWGKLYKKEHFNQLEPYSGIRVNEDYLLNFLLFQRADKIVFTDSSKYNYFENEDSVTHTINSVDSCRDICKVAGILYDKSKGKAYEQAARQRLDKANLELYSAFLLNKNVNKQEKKNCMRELKQMTKRKKQLSGNDRKKLFLFRYCPFIYTWGYGLFDSMREKKLDPEI